MCKCTLPNLHSILEYKLITSHSVKGRPHYYSTKREEYAHVKFDLDTGTQFNIHMFFKTKR